MAERFRPGERITRRAEFLRLQAGGTRIQGRFMTVQLLSNGLNTSRLGVVATRRLGGAVRRNRAKRLARELFRRNKLARPLDIIIVPRRQMIETDFAELEADYRSALRRYGA